MNRNGKRYKPIFDAVIFAILAFPMLWGILMIVVLYLLCGESNIFFVQKRAGLYGKKFNIYKFRTLDSDGVPTPLGKWLRWSSMDELPQIYNVMRREMSFVGPRPLLMEYNQLYTPEQRLRLAIKPGITGLAQINGRHLLSWERKFALDSEYFRKMSWKMDIAILYRTVIHLITFKGVKLHASTRFTN